MLTTISQENLATEMRIGSVEVIEEIGAEWRQLCIDGPSNELFYWPDWIATYLRAFEPGGRVVLVSARTRGALKAVLPLVEKKTHFCGLPILKLRGAANVHSNRFDLVRAAGAEGHGAVQAIWNAVRELPGWDVVELPDVPQGGAAEQLLQAARCDGFQVGQSESICSPCISLQGVKEPYSLALNSHFRQNLRRRWRQAEARGGLRLHRVDHADAAALARFYDLEAGGWKGKEKTAIACNPATKRFYDEVAAVAERFGFFSLYLLESAGTPIAGHFGLTYNNHYYSPKVAYDESYGQYGPGHLIVLAILRDCLQRGIKEFDFLGSSMAWKDKWASQTRRHFVCYIFQKGAFGQLLQIAQFEAMTKLRKVAHHPLFTPIRNRLRRP